MINQNFRFRCRVISKIQNHDHVHFNELKTEFCSTCTITIPAYKFKCRYQSADVLYILNTLILLTAEGNHKYSIFIIQILGLISFL